LADPRQASQYIVTSSIRGTRAIPATPAAAAHPAAFAAPFFMRGAAMGYLPVIDCNGTCSRYRMNASTPPQDALQLLGEHGLNTVRLRLFIFPYPNNSYAGLPTVLAMARRARKAGLAVSLDIFYTQWFWGPGGSNRERETPAPWRNLTFPELLQATHNYTLISVKAFVDQGTPPQSAQVGNEIGCGIYHNPPGAPCSAGGEVCKCNNNFGNLAAIITAHAGVQVQGMARPGHVGVVL